MRYPWRSSIWGHAASRQWVWTVGSPGRNRDPTKDGLKLGRWAKLGGGGKEQPSLCGRRMTSASTDPSTRGNWPDTEAREKQWPERARHGGSCQESWTNITWEKHDTTSKQKDHEPVAGILKQIAKAENFSTYMCEKYRWWGPSSLSSQPSLLH